jgi:hypothetical protein
MRKGEDNDGSDAMNRRFLVIILVLAAAVAIAGRGRRGLSDSPQNYPVRVPYGYRVPDPISTRGGNEQRQNSPQRDIIVMATSRWQDRLHRGDLKA